MKTPFDPSPAQLDFLHNDNHPVLVAFRMETKGELSEDENPDDLLDLSEE